MSRVLNRKSKIYRKRAFWVTSVKEHYWLLEDDFILEDRLEVKLLMTKLKEVNIDSPVGVTDVVEIMLDKHTAELTDKELRELTKKRKTNKPIENFNWVYNLLERYGNVFVNEKTYKKLDEKRLGNYTLEPVKKIYPDGFDGYIIWKI